MTPTGVSWNTQPTLPASFYRKAQRITNQQRTPQLSKSSLAPFYTQKRKTQNTKPNPKLPDSLSLSQTPQVVLSQTVVMAVASTSLASQLSAQFSGLRRTSPKLDHSLSNSQSLFQHVNSHLRLTSSPKPPRGVVAMAGSGKVHCLP